MRRVIGLRWQDDLKLLGFGIDSVPGLRAFVDTFLHKHAYGDETNLERVIGAEAFGYLCFDQGDQVRVLAKHKYDKDREGQVGFSPSTYKHVNKGQAYGKVELVQAVLNGQVISLLDHINLPRKELLMVLIRLVAEWVSQDLDRSCIRRALECFRKNASLDLNDGLFSLACMSVEDAKIVSVGFDANLKERVRITVAAQAERWARDNP